MNATIDIKTPSGQSLKGFPITTYPFLGETQTVLSDCKLKLQLLNVDPQLHKGDIITIEIL